MLATAIQTIILVIAARLEEASMRYGISTGNFIFYVAVKISLHNNKCHPDQDLVHA